MHPLWTSRRCVDVIWNSRKRDDIGWGNFYNDTFKILYFLIFVTHWGQDKMAAIFQAKIFNAFFWMKMFKVGWNFTEICLFGPK